MNLTTKHLSPLSALLLLRGLAVTSLINQLDAAPVPLMLPDEMSYMVSRDYRDCISPWCGGFWLKAVNEKETKCGDGTMAETCYVTEFDFSVLGYPNDEQARFKQAVASGGIMSGSYLPYVWPDDASESGNLFALVVAAGWSPFIRDFD